MKGSLRRRLARVLPVRLAAPLLLLRKGLRAELVSGHGWARSLITGEPLDESGEPIPWIPYAAVGFLAERLHERMSVLEFGAGYSTLFFATRVARVVSLEHQHRWIKRVRARATSNVTVVPTDASSVQAYLSPLADRTDRFDLVLVDGRHRNEAIAAVLPLLSDGGVVVLDDSQRARYAGAFVTARAAGFRQLHFEGHKAASVNLYRTTVFYRDWNCLGI